MINFQRLLFLALFGSLSAFSQVGSPYSEYGIGRLADDNFQSNFGMGGAATNYLSPSNLNPSNPASYGTLKYTVAEAGAFVSRNEYYSNGTFGAKDHFNLSSFGIGFPLRKNLGFAMGLQPYSKTDYSYRIQATNDDNIQTERVFRGSGNVSKLFAGLGTNIGNLSFGINGHFYFGEITKMEQLEFPTETFSNIREQQSALIRGLSAEAGLTYRLKLDEERSLLFGGTGFLGRDIDVDYFQKINNYNNVIVADSDGNLVVIEDHDNGVELLNNEDNPAEGSFSLPFQYSASVSYEKADRLFLGLTYKNSAWDNFSFINEVLDFGRQQNLALGFEYKPQKDAKGLENFWKSVIYRGGINAGTSPFKNNGEQALEYGINFGLGFPLRKYKYEGEKFGSYLYSSLGYGKLMSAGGNGINENLFKINFSVVLNDKWFVKRKFD